MGRARYRHEQKYFIPTGACEIIKSRLKTMATIDSHARKNGMYFIRSLYFDNYNDSAYVDKLDGVCDRKKYRIRIYDYGDKVINLERKKKYDAYIFKESAPITKEEFYKILDNQFDFLLKSKHKLLNEFYYECTSHLLRPKIIVDYDRVPYTYTFGDVRITLDLNVRAANSSMDIFNKKIPFIPVLERGTQILEVKFTEFIPSIFANAFLNFATEHVAASKYVLCRESKDIFSNAKF